MAKLKIGRDKSYTSILLFSNGMTEREVSNQTFEDIGIAYIDMDKIRPRFLARLRINARSENAIDFGKVRLFDGTSAIGAVKDIDDTTRKWFDFGFPNFPSSGIIELQLQARKTSASAGTSLFITHAVLDIHQ